MRRGLLGGLLLVCALAAGSCGCGKPKNCLVVPAQVDILQERRTAALAKLEDTARQVDRTQASIERVRARIAELRGQKALLDSLTVKPEQQGGE